MTKTVGCLLCVSVLKQGSPGDSAGPVNGHCGVAAPGANPEPGANPGGMPMAPGANPDGAGGVVLDEEFAVA